MPCYRLAPHVHNSRLQSLIGVGGHVAQIATSLETASLSVYSLASTSAFSRAMQWMFHQFLATRKTSNQGLLVEVELQHSVWISCSVWAIQSWLCLEGYVLLDTTTGSLSVSLPLQPNFRPSCEENPLAFPIKCHHGCFVALLHCFWYSSSKSLLLPDPPCNSLAC